MGGADAGFARSTTIGTDRAKGHGTLRRLGEPEPTAGDAVVVEQVASRRFARSQLQTARIRGLMSGVGPVNRDSG